MSLLQLQRVDYGVGGPLLLEHVDLSIESGERVCIVGRNGAGKSTLMRLIAGELKPDDGEVRLQSGVVVARMAQEVPGDAAGTVFDVVARGLGELGALLARYHHALDAGDMTAMGEAQARIEAQHGWDLDRRIGQVIEQLELPGDADFAALSGGMKRRVLLGQALVRKPDILLLDEPTNHLDIESIAWLEGFLKSFPGSLLFVTHDRSFLRALATRIVEIDRGQLTSWPGDYDNYLRRREERLHAEAMENARFDKLLAQEEVWIRQGIKARRTRNEGRVTALKAMRRERAQRRELAGNVRMEAAAAQASGRKVVEARGIRHAYGGRVLLDDVSTTIMRGDRVGLIGPNGAGKSTLLNVIIGRIPPSRGAVVFDGKVLTGKKPHEINQMGVVRVFQTPEIFPDLPVLQNVMAPAFAKRDGAFRINMFRPLEAETGIRDEAEAILEDVGLHGQRHSHAGALSRGDKRRMELAMCLIQHPRLLLLDEPTAGMSRHDTNTTIDLLKKIKARGMTKVIIEHDMHVVFSLADRISVLAGGRIIAEGEPDAVRNDPRVQEAYLGGASIEAGAH